MQPFDLLITALATWYIAHVITALPGPLRLFERLREIKHLAEFLSCIYCVSVWVAGVVYLLSQNETSIYIVYPFAIAGGALMLRTYTGAGMHGL